MPTLTMTPCYSIMLCSIAVILIMIMALPVVFILARKTWEWMNTVFVKIKKK